MNRLVLANRDYGPAGDGWGAHVTDEGFQLQESLRLAGWTLAGHGYGDGCRDVLTLLSRHSPDVILIQDVRDWRRDSGGCFNPAVEFQNWQCLKDCPAFKVTPVKDAGSVTEYQRRFCQDIAADAVVTYYHDDAVLALSPWLSQYDRVRTYHSIDADLCRSIDLGESRSRAIVTGAVSGVYPLRQMVFRNAERIGVTIRVHPGYGNAGCQTPDYLRMLARYRVHVATASRFHFSLRKIIESVAVGCTPITDLPTFDRLPEIDQALIRIPSDATAEQVRDVVDEAESDWNIERAMYYAEKCWRRYDYRVQGRWLSERLTELSLAIRD